jgi:hypothetical protein
MTFDDVPMMRVSDILDRTTLVIAGPGVEKLTVGEELHIFAVGKEISGLGIPLVVPKATVEVTSVAGVYAIARSPEYTEKVSAFALDMFGRTVSKRDALNVDEKSLKGNPGSAPIRPGDPAVQLSKLPELVKALAAVAAKSSE